MENIKKISEQSFSYKLDIRIKPNSKIEDRKSSNAYWLTEYYDSVSGLKMRFKGIRGQNDKQYVFRPVDDFDESGTETEFPEFPLHWVFNFLFSIGEYFHGGEDHIVIKWPEYLEKEFKRMGISTKNFDDYDESMIWDIEKNDKDFFELLGRPKISGFTTDESSSNYQNFTINAKEINYQVKLKIFWPGEDSEVEEYIPPIHK